MTLLARHSIIVLFLSLFIAASALGQAPRPPTLTTREIARKAFPSVVLLVTEDADGEASSLGSGFFVRADVVATSYHVIKDASRIFAKVVGSKTVYEVEEIVSIDEETDLALLRIKTGKVRTLPLGNSSSVRIGDAVYVIGNPEGLEGTFSQGIVSAIRQVEGQRMVQITAPISHGSSGGPVLNNKGQVIGIATAILKEGQNLNFAVPVSSLMALLKTYAAPKITTSNPLSSNRKRQRQTRVERDDWEEITPNELPNGKEQEIANAKKEVLAHPNSAEAYYKLGNAYSSQYDTDSKSKAAEAYRKAIRIKPDYADAHERLGDSYFFLGRYKEALDSITEAIRIRPDFERAYVGIGFVYCKMGQHEKSAEAFKKATQLDPKDDAGYFFLAREYHHLNRNNEAVEIFRQVIQLFPSEAGYASTELGKLYNELGRYTEALAAYKQAIRNNPDYAEAHEGLGNVYKTLGRYKEAIDAYTQALRLQPDSFETHVGLGWAYAHLDRYDEALNEFNLANANHEDHANAYFGMGWVLAAKGNNSVAIQAYEKSLSLDPKQPEAHYNLGLIYLELGDKGAALNEYKRLKDLNKDLANKLFDKIYK